MLCETLRESRVIPSINLGKDVAQKYLNNIEEALNRLREYPPLLRQNDDISPHFSFFRVKDHFLVCTRKDDHVYGFSVFYGRMDLPARLS